MNTSLVIILAILGVFLISKSKTASDDPRGRTMRLVGIAFAIGALVAVLLGVADIVQEHAANGG